MSASFPLQLTNFSDFPGRWQGKMNFGHPPYNVEQSYRWFLVLPVALGFPSLGFVDATNVLCAEVIGRRDWSKLASGSPGGPLDRLVICDFYFISGGCSPIAYKTFLKFTKHSLFIFRASIVARPVEVIPIIRGKNQNSIEMIAPFLPSRMKQSSHFSSNIIM